MSRFAEQEREVRTGPGAAFVVREASFDDLDGIADLTAGRSGVEVEKLPPWDQSEVPANPGDRRLFIVESDGAVVGFGRVARLEIPSLPSGWYLAGAVIDADHATSELGHVLTRKRLDWIGERAPEAFSCADSDDSASIIRHAELGFDEVANPGLKGNALLYRISLPLKPAFKSRR
ncbi:MAG: hypothetical protein KIT11_03180 [Fimbriimonadaceae bacterium]|nr:hypothetical protein [Fimbriimonadaceae bacterium]QYK57100.1 MAG: hypothetical protein KF733_06345 [Fimbriimonadaceae bacterium]